MKLLALTAAPHPAGNRVDLAWTNPDPAGFPGVRVVRRTATHPTSPEDGVVVAEGADLAFTALDGGARAYTLADTGLRGETVYYYALFPYAGDPPVYDVDAANRATATATAGYGMAERMGALLPALYHRYDAAGPAPGFLRRFLQIPGAELDYLHSAARTALDLYDVDRVDGRLLPLLAAWIGWDTNHRLDVATQRNELRSAPSLYQTIGIVPTVEATIKRVLGWESSAKEFVHNVARSNAPERLNPHTLRRGPGETAWTPSDGPLSLDWDTDGRPAAVVDGDGVLWLFFATLRSDRWDLWSKTLRTFTVPADLQADLESGVVTPDLRDAWDDAGFPLPADAEVRASGDGWQVAAPDGTDRYAVRPEAGALAVQYWAPSERLTNDATVDKHPAALVAEGALHLFWDRYDPATGRWRVIYRARAGGVWSHPETFGDDGTDRRSPAVVADDTGGVWAFWMERAAGGRWGLRYLRRPLGEPWAWDQAHDFPTDGGADPRVHDGVFAVFQPAAAPGDGTARIWVFWARKAVGAGGTRWQVAGRAATGMDPDALTWIHTWSEDFPDHHSVDTDANPVDLSLRTWYVNRPLDWSPVFTLPGSGVAFGARDPAAYLDESGALQLFYAGDQGGSWSVWRAALQAAEPPAWGAPERLTEGAFTHSGPFPCLVAGGTLVIHRSNQSVRYGSRVYRATETLDARYAGTTTADSRNVAKTALRESFEDFATYTYDTGVAGVRTDRDWYSRDTVGVYLDAPTEDQRTIIRNRNLLTNVLRQFLPAPVRVVFIIPIVTREAVYTYDLPDADPQRLIGEEVADQLTSPAADTYGGVASAYADAPDGWVFASSWSQDTPDPSTIDTAAVPVTLNPRTRHTGIHTGE